MISISITHQVCKGVVPQQDSWKSVETPENALKYIAHFIYCVSFRHSHVHTHKVHKSVCVGKSIVFIHSVYLFVCSGAGWSSVDPVSALDLQARVAEGEFWLDETEFLSQFDDVTVGYPISDDGHLKSIYTGNSLLC